MIGFDPEHFGFSATQGGPNPPSDTLYISNWGTGTLYWSVTDDAPWLILSATSGSSKDENDISAVAVSVDISGLSPGDYEAEITISQFSDNVDYVFFASLTVHSKDDNGGTTPGLISFDNPITYEVPKYPVALVVADFNNDENLDIAIVNNNGKIKRGVGALPYYDGKKKISYLIVFLGDGKGGFEIIRRYKAGINSVDMCSGDFNGDSIIDIAVANAGRVKIVNPEEFWKLEGKVESHSISIFYGKLNGEEVKFKKKKIKSVNLPVNVFSADLNLDGRDELLLLEDKDNLVHYPFDEDDFKGEFKLTVLKSKKRDFLKDKSFPKKLGFGMFVEDEMETGRIFKGIGLVVGDFDNDGDPDLISSKQKLMYPVNYIFYLENQSDGAFTKKKVELNEDIFSSAMVATGDFNNDMFQDIVSIGSQGRGIGQIGFGDGNSSLSVSKLHGCMGNWYRLNMKMFVADLNGDNNLDFVFPWIPGGISYSDEEDRNICGDLFGKYGTWIVPMFGDGNGGFSNSRIEFHHESLGMIPRAVTGGDFNNDGKVDLAVIGSNVDKLAIFLQK